MKNIYIVRHGESVGNARAVYDKEYVIDSSVKLTENGIIQAKEAGEKLNKVLASTNGAFWVSPFERTRATYSNILQTLDDKFKTFDSFEDPRLVEQDFGDFDFQFFHMWKEISPHSFFVNQERYNDPVGRFFARLENGENMLDVYNRISLFVKTRLEPCRYKENVIVTHGNAGRALAMFLLDMKIEEFYESDVPPNASVRYIAHNGERYIDMGYVE